MPKLQISWVDIQSAWGPASGRLHQVSRGQLRLRKDGLDDLTSRMGARCKQRAQSAEDPRLRPETTPLPRPLQNPQTTDRGRPDSGAGKSPGGAKISHHRGQRVGDEWSARGCQSQPLRRRRRQPEKGFPPSKNHTTIFSRQASKAEAIRRRKKKSAGYATDQATTRSWLEGKKG